MSYLDQVLGDVIEDVRGRLARPGGACRVQNPEFQVRNFSSDVKGSIFGQKSFDLGHVAAADGRVDWVPGGHQENVFITYFCSTCLQLARTRSTFSSHCPHSSN